MDKSPEYKLLAGGLLVAASMAFSMPLSAKDKISQESRARDSATTAEVVTKRGSVTFIDESHGGSFAVGILEQGKTNLAAYYEREATPLEIYLALSKDGNQPPPFLVRAHEEARRINPEVPVHPRSFATLVNNGGAKAVGYYGFAHDTSNCWSWGDVNQYDTLVGNAPGSFGGHKSGQAYQQFLDWAGIAGTSFQNNSWASNGAYFDENAEISDKSYATGFAHERAFAICVTHAVVQPSESQFDCAVPNGVSENTVDYRIRLYVESSNGDTWHSDWIHLLGYGDGARYRSSSNAKRRYELRVVDISKTSLVCKERYDVFWRARIQGPHWLPNGLQLSP